MVSRATGRRAVTSVNHSRCAVVLKEIQRSRYHGPGLWAWRKIFPPLRGTSQFFGVCSSVKYSTLSTQTVALHHLQLWEIRTVKHRL